jgi:hypothetical protein
MSDPRQWRRSRRLQEMSRTIGSIMDGLDSEAADWVAQQFPRVYGAGLIDGAAAAGTSPAWSMIHQEAVEQLAYGVYQDLLSATTHVKDTTKDLIRTLARQEGTFALIGGETAQGAGRNLARELARHSIAAVIYKDGSRHGLADYADMNLRTTTALGYNNGTLNAAPQTVFWEVFDGPGCGWTFHEDTEQALGKIVTRDEALSWPISHPRCRRAFGPRPDLNKTASAKEKLGSVKDSQVVAQRAQDAERLAKQQRAGRTSRTARSQRSPRNQAAARPDAQTLARLYEDTPKATGYGSEAVQAKAVFHQLGYDGVPRLVDSAVEVEAVAGSPGDVLHRAVADPAHAEQLRTGALFSMEGAQGTGIYTVQGTFEEFSDYVNRAVPSTARAGNNLTMALPADARVLSFDSARALDNWSVEHASLGSIADDPGALAAALGYDAIRVTRSTETFVIVMNRAKLVVAK